MAGGVGYGLGANGERAQVALASNLTGDEERVYELVARHFLASCSGDARGERTQVRRHTQTKRAASEEAWKL